ncbi:MAG: lipopolysaccharide transport system permease protein [Rhodospirillaceae bacterium]|jgi:lipopolysaccharide transport system permease protein|nr:lipopolysaccharide transport system permease protein [Rhodospirillaceae bacterium]
MPRYRHDLQLAWRDLVEAARQWAMIVQLGWHDVRQRYRRSTLGPLWLTVSIAVQVAALGLVYGRLFHLDAATYLPHLAVGMTVWALIAGMINDGCLCFIAAEGFLKQVAMPKSVFPARVVLRSLITFGHDAVIVLAVLLIFKPLFGWSALLALVGLLLLAINGLWVGLMLGTLCARFRDLPPIIASVLQVAFFITPVIWQPQTLTGDWALLLRLNPFASFLTLIRNPLLGEPVGYSSWVIVLFVTLVGWTGAFLLFTRFRARITYWL